MTELVFWCSPCLRVGGSWRKSASVELLLHSKSRAWVDDPDYHFCAPHNTAAEHAGTHEGMGQQVEQGLLRQIHTLRQQALSTTPRKWTAESVRHSLSSMRGNPREMLRLLEKAIEGLAKVMQAEEESLALPTQIGVNVVALLGKPNGAGERPITLTGCLYAIFIAGY